MSALHYSRYRSESGNAKVWICVAIVLALMAIAHDRAYDDEIALETAKREYRNWIARNCLPQKANERCVIEKRQDGSVQATKHENVGYGRAPRLVFAEVREPN